MKFFAATALALAASVIAAPLESNPEIEAREIEARAKKTVGPFRLKITGKKENPSIDGYLASYHAGAAIQALAYVTDPSDEFYLNKTSYSSELWWKLPSGDQEYPIGFDLNCYPGSNVCSVMGDPGSSTTTMAFNKDGQLYVGVYRDDSDNVPYDYPKPYTANDAGSWVLCWQYLNSYYYRSLGYALSFPTTNPTCRPVFVTKEAIKN